MRLGRWSLHPPKKVPAGRKGFVVRYTLADGRMIESFPTVRSYLAYPYALIESMQAVWRLREYAWWE